MKHRASIKSAVLQDHLNEQVYVIARQYMRRIFDRYNDLILNK
jgi:hypothetical protein